MIGLKPINVFMATGEITKNGTFVTTFHKPGGGTSHWKFANTSEDKFQDQWTLIQ